MAWMLHNQDQKAREERFTGARRREKMLLYPKFMVLTVSLGLCLATPLQAAGSTQNEDSVHSWGPWETLAPAAGGVPTVAALPVESGVELRPGEAAVLTPRFQAVDQNDGGSEPVVVKNPGGGLSPVDPRAGLR